MQITEKMEAQNILKGLPEDSTFEDIQYHLYVAAKIKKARDQVKEGKLYSQEQAENRLAKWIIR